MVVAESELMLAPESTTNKHSPVMTNFRFIENFL